MNSNIAKMPVFRFEIHQSTIFLPKNWQIWPEKHTFWQILTKKTKFWQIVLPKNWKFGPQRQKKTNLDKCWP